jgi:proteic killer suppression protein
MLNHSLSVIIFCRYRARARKEHAADGSSVTTTSMDRHFLPLVYSRMCVAMRYTSIMIVSFSHKGLETLYKTGSTRGVQAAHAPKLRRILAALDAATSPTDLNQPGYKLHPLKAELKGHWSIWVNGNWRVTFRFVGNNTELIDYQDYH